MKLTRQMFNVKEWEGKGKVWRGGRKGRPYGMVMLFCAVSFAGHGYRDGPTGTYLRGMQIESERLRRRSLRCSGSSRGVCAVELAASPLPRDAARARASTRWRKRGRLRWAVRISMRRATRGERWRRDMWLPRMPCCFSCVLSSIPLAAHALLAHACPALHSPPLLAL